MEKTIQVYGSEVPVKNLCGWGVWRDNLLFDYIATKQLVRETFALWSDNPISVYKQLHVVGAAPYQSGQRSMLWEVGRKVIGADPPNYPQQVGDCVSFGAKNAIEHLQFFPMANGQRMTWTQVFPPYLWGCGRIFIGKNKLGTQDGSVGAWQAEAVKQYGTLPLKMNGLPAYSGTIARLWGNMPGPSDKWVTQGKEHIVKSAAFVQTWQDLVQALVNGYPVTCASHVGFDMQAQADGFMHYDDEWGHQMCIIGVDDDPSDPYACILNSWGDVHGHIKDFKSGDTWPVGTLRVRKKDIEAILAEQDSFAYSSLTYFAAQTVDKDKFDLW